MPTLKLIDWNKKGDCLVIETDEGLRYCKLSFSNIGELIEACEALKGKQVQTTTYGTYDPKKWFNGITEATEISNIHKGSKQFPLERDFATKTQQKIYGPPGTGKTTRLMDEVELAIKNGVKPGDIGFIAFTNAAAEVAKERAIERFPAANVLDFSNFCTLHSLATRVGGNSGKTLMKEEHFKSFDSHIICFEEMTTLNDVSSLVTRFKHPVLDFCSLAKSRLLSLEDLFSQDGLWLGGTIAVELERRFGTRDPLEIAKRYQDDFLTFKTKNGLASFDDVIDIVVDDNFPESSIPTFELLIVDEAQDLSKHLWLFANRLIKNAKKVFIAGDDDQAIHSSVGASPETFNTLQTSEKNDPLPHSFRLPKPVKNYVDRGVMKAIEAMPNREQKQWNPNDKEGVVTSSVETTRFDQDKNQETVTASDITPTDLLKILSSKYNGVKGTTTPIDWLLLTPTRAGSERLSRALKTSGVPHFLRNRAVGQIDSLGNQQIRVTTMHASKGDQSQNVALIFQTPGDIWLASQDPRLAYVAQTRAMEALYPRVIRPNLISDVYDRIWGSDAVDKLNRWFPR